MFSFFSLVLNDEEDIIPVFDNGIEEYNIYVLDLSKEQVTTNNITNYFDDIKILEIYPYINPIYKKFIKKSYTFNTSISTKKNISNFIVEYMNQLKQNALTSEMVLFNLNGIKIDKIKVYTSKNQINKLTQIFKIRIINN